MAKQFGGEYYSFHAGFLLDPNISELGKKVKQRELQDRGLALNLFLNRVNEIDRFAQSLSVRLLVENNVISHFNFKNFKHY